MPMRNDRGRLVIQDEPDGTTSLTICEDVVDGEPVNVYARYFHVPQLEIGDGVAVTRHGRGRHTEEIVDVVGRGERVSVRYPSYRG